MSGSGTPQAPTQEQVDEAFAKVKAHPNIMGQAMGMANMAYAFQFAQHAVPKAEIVSLEAVNENLMRLHKAKAVIISVSVLPPKGNKLNVLISYYAPEGI